MGEHIRWISHIDASDIKDAGGKGAILGDMYNAKFPVPQAFIVTTDACSFFLHETGLKQQIQELLRAIDVDNTHELRKKSEEIRALIVHTEMPHTLAEAIVEAYDHFNVDLKNYKDSPGALAILKSAREPIFVSVRSSSTAEDTDDASFAGQQDSFINIKGNKELLDTVKKVFASLFTARSLYYRAKKGYEDFVPSAVIVQKMIDSEKSGVIFSKHPVKKTHDILIEAVWGQGDGIVSGRIKPDQYVLSEDLEIVSEEVSDKKLAVVRNSSGQTKMVQLNDDISQMRVLKTHELKSLAEYALKLETHFGKPQDIEFAIEHNEIFILQSRPITTLGQEQTEQHIDGQVVSSGLAASPGIATGTVKIIHTMDDLEKIKEGDILVTTMTNPDMIVSMQKVQAIVTSEGGVTAHAAIVAREMGIPAVVGAQNIMDALQDGMEITVDGFSGNVFLGATQNKSVDIEPVVPTKTQIKVMVDLPKFAERAAQAQAAGVGLVRLEGLVALAGVHPLAYEREGNLSGYQTMLTNGLKDITEQFIGKPIWVRTSDIRSDEYAALRGAPQDHERNPALGNHGIRFSLQHEDIFRAELQAIKSLADHGHQFGVMLPQVMSVSEVERAKEIFREVGCDGKVAFGLTIETPAATVIIKDLLQTGVDFVSIGTNDLTQYTLAIDRGNESIQHLYDDMHIAVQKQIARVLRECKAQGIATSISGQAASTNPEMVAFLVKQGIQSITVTPDVAKETSVLVNRLENGEDITSIVAAEENREETHHAEGEVVQEKQGHEQREEHGGEYREEEREVVQEAAQEVAHEEQPQPQIHSEGHHGEHPEERHDDQTHENQHHEHQQEQRNEHTPQEHHGEEHTVHQVHHAAEPQEAHIAHEVHEQVAEHPQEITERVEEHMAEQADGTPEEQDGYEAGSEDFVQPTDVAVEQVPQEGEGEEEVRYEEGSEHQQLAHAGNNEGENFAEQLVEESGQGLGSESGNREGEHPEERREGHGM